MALDNSRLLAQIKLKSALPDGRYTDQEILDIVYDCLVSNVQPLIIGVREEFFVKSSRISLIAGTGAYPIESRALGLVLRELKLDLGNGEIRDLPRIDLEDIGSAQSGSPYSFYLLGNDVVLHPTPDTTGPTLVQYYFERAPRPVEVSACARITSVDVGTGVLTADTPTGWVSGSAYDLISSRNGSDILARDLIPSDVTATTITFAAADLPRRLAIGDYVALSQESPFCAVPDEALPYLQQVVCVELLEALGSLSERGVAQEKADRLRDALMRVLSNRIQGAPKRFGPQMLTARSTRRSI